MRDEAKLWTPGFILLNLQFLIVTSVTALFFPFQAYLQGLGFSQETIGVIIGADALASLFIQPIAALLIHARSARLWLAGGSAIFAIALFLEGRSTAFAPLLATRLLQGAGFSCAVSALIAMIVETIPAGMSGRAFGWTSLIRLVPYAAAPLLFDALAIAPAAFGQTLQAAAVLALAPASTAFMLRGANASPSRTQAAPPGFSGALASLGDRRVALLLVACLMLYSGYAATFFYVRELAVSLGIGASGLFFTLATSTMMLTRLLGGALFDLFDKVLLSVGGLCLIAVSYAALPLAQHPELFFALALFLGLGWGAVMPLQAAIMFDVSPEAARGLNQNLLMTMMQASFFTGPALAGILLSASGFNALFLSAASASLLAALATQSIRQH
jgi:predicted MFS family arabinose efflux permease